MREVWMGPPRGPKSPGGENSYCWRALRYMEVMEDRIRSGKCGPWNSMARRVLQLAVNFGPILADEDSFVLRYFLCDSGQCRRQIGIYDPG